MLGGFLIEELLSLPFGRPASGLAGFRRSLIPIRIGIPCPLATRAALEQFLNQQVHFFAMCGSPLFLLYNIYMKLTFHGGTGMVTGANYLLEAEGTKIMVDCGLHQGSNFCEKHNFEPFPYNPKEINAVFVTHAHIDHTGRLPQLLRQGFRGVVYSTPPTRDFAELLLIDSEHVMLEEAKHLHKKPLYNMDDVGVLMNHWRGVPYHEQVTVGPFKITLANAGHILGSALVIIDGPAGKGKSSPSTSSGSNSSSKVFASSGNIARIIFSGDLGNSPAPMIGATEVMDGTDYCVVESTYGDRFHEGVDTRQEVVEDMIENVVKSKGVLMIPAFAMERTQELLFEINSLAEGGRIPRVPIYLDSPLAIKLTSVYKKYEDYYDQATRAIIGRGDAIFNFPGLHTMLTTEESKEINNASLPKVIIAGSGMSNGGRILHHEMRYLSDPNSAILFVGYQAAGTLGRRILDGEKSVKIFGEDIPVRCRVMNIPGFSAHADQRQLLAWIEPMRATVKKVFVVQGEEESSKVLAQKMADELAVTSVVPKEGESYDIL